MRRTVPAQSRVILFTALCALAACEDQCFEPPPESELSVDFVSPTEGQVLTHVDDSAPGTLGFQRDVVVKAADSGGRAVTLESASLQSRLLAETTFTPGPDPQISGDTATFPAVELRQGTNVLQVTVIESGTGRQATRTINVDAQVSRPEVLTFRFQGDTNGDGALIQAEQATSDPVAQVTVRGVEDGQTVTIRAQGAVGTVYGAGTVTGGAATVTLDGLGVTDTTEATYQLVASVVDRMGRDNVTANPTLSYPLNDVAFRTLVVDRVRPAVLTFQFQDDLNNDGALNQAEQATGDPVALLTVQGAEDGQPIIVRAQGASGATYGTGTVAGGSVAVTLTGLSVTDTTEASFQLVASVIDRAGNTNVVANATPSQPLNGPAFKALAVDRVRPAVLTFLFQNDANGDGALIQAEQATGDPVALLIVQGLEDGQPVVVRAQGPGGAVHGTGTATGGAAAVTLAGLGVTATTEATYQLVVSVTDRAGNDNVIANATPTQPLNTAAFRALTVDRVVPALTLLSPSVPGTSQILHLADDADPATDGFQVRIAIQTSAEVETNGVQVTRTPPGMTDTLTPDAVNHQASVDFTVPDTGPYDYTVTVSVADPAGNARNRTFTLQIGGGGSSGFFTAPGFSDTTLNGPPGGPFKFDVRRTVPLGGAQAIVAATNVFYWNASAVAELPTTAIVDQDLATAGAQVVVNATVIGGSGCTARLLYNGTPVPGGTVLGTNSPVPVSLSATLASGSAGPLRFVADCGGGRVYGRPPADLTVDVDPPSAVPATLALVTTGAFSARRPAVDVAWTGGNDDGSGGTGTASGFELRWGSNATLRPSISPAPANLYDQRPGIDSDLRYFDPNRAQLPPGGSLPSSATTFRLTGLPPIEDYFVQVRARDDVGNLSLLAPTSCATGAGCLSHQLQVATLHNPGTTGLIGYVMEAADLNGDTAADLAFTGIGSPRTAWVAYGGATPFSTVAQVVPPVSTLDATTDPYSIAVGNAGDLATGGSFADLALADPTWDTFRGRYFLYFGRSGTIDPVPVELRGVAQNLNSGQGSGTTSETGHIRLIADFGSPGGGPPDGRAELAISANNALSGLGRVYLFYGRPHDPLGGAGSWQELATTTDGDGIPYIPLSAADRIFGGESPPPCTRCPATMPVPSSAFFGIRLGYASLGDITGDGVSDFTIPSARDFVNRLYVFSGGAVNAAGAGSGVVIVPSNRVQRIDESEPLTPDGSWRGFGAHAVGGVDVIGGAGMDLAVGFPRVNTVQLYRDGSATGFDASPPSVLKIVGRTTNFGRSIATADLDQDGRMDLVVGTNACRTLCTDGFAGGAWVFYNRRPSTPEYDLSTDDAAFRTTRLMKDFAVTGDSDALGLGVATGDFNGDGIPDVAVSDPAITSAPGRGKIYVRY